jgi:hypothetical protein
MGGGGEGLGDLLKNMFYVLVTAVNKVSKMHIFEFGVLVYFLRPSLNILLCIVYKNFVAMIQGMPRGL